MKLACQRSIPQVLRARFLSTASAGPKNKKRLILVRHGEVDLSQFDGRPAFYGALNVPLSSNGKEEAASAAEMLRKSEKIDHMFASPLDRALFGAKCIASAQNMDEGSITTHPGFKEVDRGDWVGRVVEEVGDEELNRWKNDATHTMEGGESLKTLSDRVLKAKNEILQTVPWGSTACLVSHMWVTRIILAEVHGLDTIADTHQIHDIVLPTASVSCVEYHQSGSSEVVYQGVKPPHRTASAGDHWGG